MSASPPPPFDDGAAADATAPSSPGHPQVLNGPPPGALDGTPSPAADDLPISPGDVASAGRSCSAILILLAAILVVLCVGTALRWIILS